MRTYLILTVCVSLSLVTSAGYAVFGTPDPVEVNTDRIIRVPYLSCDELTAYFYHNDGRPNSDDIFSSTRPDKSSPFGTPSLVPGVCSEDTERHPCLSLDELTIYYMSGEFGNRDLYVATRISTSDPFANHAALTELNSGSNDGAPSITADGLTIVYHSNRSGGLGDYDLYMATRLDTDSPFGAPVNITELNSSNRDIFPSISSDGRAIYFQTLRSSSFAEIWMATRPDTALSFSAPFRIDEINEEGILSFDPCVSRDGKTIYFCSNRDGSLPGGLWMAEVIPRAVVATGGGWILPENDGLNTHPNQRASFGFNVRHKKGLPTAHINFFCSQGHIHLRSTSIEQLVVAGGKIAQFVGWASVNGQEGNWFLVEAIDNGEPGKGIDWFEIKIWSPFDDPDDDPTERAAGVLEGGNISVFAGNSEE